MISLTETFEILTLVQS